MDRGMVINDNGAARWSRAVPEDACGRD